MIVSAAKLAAEAGDVTTRMIRTYAAEGMPREGRGKYDLDKCLKWIREHYPRTGHGGKRGEETDAADNARDEDAKTFRMLKSEQLKGRLIREQLELGALQGKYIDRAATTQTVRAHIEVVRQAVEKIPLNAAKAVAQDLGLPADRVPTVRNAIAGIVKKVLDRIARDPLPEDFAQTTASPPSAPIPRKK